MGRWTWHEFGQNERRLRVYTIYRVNDGSDHASGENTAWLQQKRFLLRKNIQVNPRKHVMESLIQELKLVVNEGVNIIVGGDFNEGLISSEGVREMMQGIGLCNAFEHRLGTHDLPRTHSRGCKAVDHLWVTPFLLNNIVQAGIATFGFLLDSDHRGMFLDIDDSMLFEPEDVRLVFHDHRRLKSNIPKRIKKYMRIIESDWKVHKVNENICI